jgi:hypothetical protein
METLLSTLSLGNFFFEIFFRDLNGDSTVDVAVGYFFSCFENCLFFFLIIVRIFCSSCSFPQLLSLSRDLKFRYQGRLGLYGEVCGVRCEACPHTHTTHTCVIRAYGFV